MKDASKAINTSKVYSSREEDKYVVPIKYYEAILATLNGKLPRPFPDTRVSSVYFDSPKLDFVKMHLEKVKERRKLRIRSYNTDKTHFLEDKYKKNDRSFKRRVVLNDKLKQDVIQNRRLTKSLELAELNKDNPDFMTNAAIIIGLMRQYNVRPTMQMSYLREAFGNDELRITMDKQVEGGAMCELPNPKFSKDLMDRWREIGNSHSNARTFILEVKYAAKEPPKWVTAMIKQYGLQKMAFSKYMWGMLGAVGGN